MQAFFINILLIRLLIGLVVFINLTCAVTFLLTPSHYAPGFELTGPIGEAAIQGFGVLFLMWNVPYVVAFLDPIHNRTALFESIAMQGIGLLGESYIYYSLPSIYATARSSISRFIFFDLLGLGLLFAVFYLVHKK